MENYYEPGEIAERLCSLGYSEWSQNMQSECEEALYQLKAIAENEYNSDYWRTLWNTLQRLCEVG